MADSRLLSPAGTARSDENDGRLLELVDSLTAALEASNARIATLEGSVSTLQDNVVYQVSFDTDGGSAAPDAQIVLAGDKATAPSDPTKEGYTFAGWYNGATAWTFATDTVTGSLTLKAHWTEV